MPTGAPTTDHEQAHMPGAKRIERSSKTTYRVCVVVAEEEQARRQEAARRADLEHEACMRTLPRPAPLVTLLRDLRSGNDPNLAKFASADDYRLALQRFVPTLIGSDPNCLERLDGLKSVDGYVYGIASESRERIEEAIRDLYFALRDVEVHRRKFDARTDAEKAATRDLLARAESDPAFQAFLGRLNLDRGKPSAGDDEEDDE